MKNFSERESSIIEILGRKKMTLEEISSDLFKVTKDKPFDAVISVSNSVRRIIKKCEHHKLGWTLRRTRENNKLIVKRITRGSWA